MQRPGTMAPPPRPDPTSRQTSNTSSNMTNGTTATSSSENWESYSDASELDHERDMRDVYPPKTLGHSGRKIPAAYSHMAPPPNKMRTQNYYQPGTTVQMADENHYIMGERLASVEGSEGAWSTEAEETY